MPQTYADKYVNSPSDIPRKPHWAIIRSESVFIPGDERSRTAPGHGYPERTEYYIKYEVYYNEEDFKKALENNAKSMYSSPILGMYVDTFYTTVPKVEVVKSND